MLKEKEKSKNQK